MLQIFWSINEWDVPGSFVVFFHLSRNAAATTLSRMFWRGEESDPDPPRAAGRSKGCWVQSPPLRCQTPTSTNAVVA